MGVVQNPLPDVILFQLEIFAVVSAMIQKLYKVSRP
jgi:hypothetical protein